MTILRIIGHKETQGWLPCQLLPCSPLFLGRDNSPPNWVRGHFSKFGTLSVYVEELFEQRMDCSHLARLTVDYQALFEYWHSMEEYPK